MKTRILLAVCLVLAGISAAKAQRSIIALHHEGEVTFFPGSATQAAMDASAPGDTLYLSEGSFAGFNVTHGIAVLGAGDKTVFSGNITITENKDEIDTGNYTFNGLYLLNDFVVDSDVNGFSMEQCTMTKFIVNEDKSLDQGTICMCYIGNTLELKPSVLGLEVINSKMWAPSGIGKYHGAVSFYNCNFNEQYYDNSDPENANNNVFTNCIMYAARYGSFINCIYDANNKDVSLVNCWRRMNWKFADQMGTPWTDDNLIENGNIGTDGTVVGITGGEVPYTHELFAPHVVEHKLDVDNVSGTLKVTLKMAGDKTAEDDAE